MEQSSLVLVSFCNVQVPNLVLGLFDFATGFFSWVDVDQLTPVAGALGMCRSDNFVFVALSHFDGSSRLSAWNNQMEFFCSRQLEMTQYVHSIIWRHPEVWLVDTAHNRVTAIVFDPELAAHASLRSPKPDTYM